MTGNKQTIFYLAYGSNLHPDRLWQRVPSAKFLGAICVSGYQIKFYKKSTDDSSKCSLKKTDKMQDLMYFALYEINQSEKYLLDKAEGVGHGYKDIKVKFSYKEKEYVAFTYMAMESHIDENLLPYSWYKDLVIAGARFYNFPSNYIEDIEAIPTCADHDDNRVKSNQSILEKIRKKIKKLL